MDKATNTPERQQHTTLGHSEESSRAQTSLVRVLPAYSTGGTGMWHFGLGRVRPSRPHACCFSPAPKATRKACLAPGCPGASYLVLVLDRERRTAEDGESRPGGDTDRGARGAGSLQHYKDLRDDEEMSVLDTYEEGRRARRAIATCRPLWFFLEWPNFCLFFVNDTRRHVSRVPPFWGGLVPDTWLGGDRRCAC